MNDPRIPSDGTVYRKRKNPSPFPAYSLDTYLDHLDAFIFDMDGVITDTARIHADAWKQLFDEYLEQRAVKLGEHFRAFDADVDYHRYVDGKPRYDGVRSFLESRGISLPLGSSDDTPEQETVCGLGNRKNEYYLDRLKKGDVNAYSSSIEMIEKLKERGIRTAVISSSRNSDAVLESAGIRHLFDVKVDGIDMAKMGLEGKPDPAIFLEAAHRLRVVPERAAVVEDALAGVEAASRGGFRLVIGVDRGAGGEHLRKQGAEVVVHDLGELEISAPRGDTGSHITTRVMQSLPSALQQKEAIFNKLLSGKPVVVFLDYDGTLTPIVNNPPDAILPIMTKDVLKRLAKRSTVAIISGRDLRDVENMVGINDAVYAGSHGFDIMAADGSSRSQDWLQRYMPVLDQAETALRGAVSDIAGALVERKRFAIAVHYRNVNDAYLKTLEERFHRVLEQYPSLRKSKGKKVLELRPDVDWDKGKAIISMLETLHLDMDKVVPFFIGDDITDEDGFRAIYDRGISIVVGSEARDTAAHYTLQDPTEVRIFLESLIDYITPKSPGNDWALVYEGFDAEQEPLREALCTLGNGFFATRGATPESQADDVHYPGTYIAGCYNRLKTEISGHAIENEDLVNVPNWLPLNFRIEGSEWFDLNKADLLDYRQELDLRQGVLNRFIRFSDSNGRRAQLKERRFVHMADPHLAGLEMSITAENWSGYIDIRSGIDGNVRNTGVVRYRQLSNAHLLLIECQSLNDILCLQVTTNQSHIEVAEAARTQVYLKDETIDVPRKVIQDRSYIAHEFTINIQQGEMINIEKLVALFTSKDNAISDCVTEAVKKVRRSANFATLLESHTLAWDNLWRRCDIAIQNSKQNALALHLHIFHILQTVSLNDVDLDVGIPARGLHGEAYRGHIFWDELFIFPFFNLRLPGITRELLLYRYRRLSEARWAAKQAGYEGAMYPWQSGSDGREESQIIHLNPRSGRWVSDSSHLQRHINAAIAYNVWNYYQVSGDIDFLSSYGAEMIIEIARFWASIAKYNPSLDRYEIHKVMGPDEYHDSYPDAIEPGLNNNAYTNLMAVWVLCRALDVLDILPQDSRDILWDKLGLQRQELEKWDDISRKMRIVFHEDGIISQFEGYEGLEEFDWEGYQLKYGNIQRLDRILEAGGDTLNRYKVSKQADVLMLFYLLSADELRELFERLGYTFEYEAIPNNINYYLQRTSHGSTLSRVVHSWVLARSQRELSWHLFTEALKTDISDIQGGTTSEGIHLGAMAGTVDLIQRCYTGLETREDTLWFNPCLPYDLKEVHFDIHYRGHWINLKITSDHLRFHTRPYGLAPLKVGFQDTIYELKPGDTAEIPIVCPTS